MIDKKAAIEAYKLVERNAHDTLGDPAGYLALTGQCPVAVVERQAQRLAALLAQLDEAEAALAALKGDPNNINWCSPKSVRQLIQQLCTLDPDMETTALLRMPADFRDGKAIRQVPISISYERMDGQWLAPYKSEGREVLAFWAKPDDRRTDERGEELTEAKSDQVPVAWIVHARGGDQLTTDGDYVANAEGIGGVHSTPLFTAQRCNI